MASALYPLKAAPHAAVPAPLCLFFGIMSFTVRLVASSEEIASVFSPLRRKLRVGRGTLDHVSYFAADETGFYAGKLDGKFISCLSVVKYSEEYAYIGNYAVDEPYRGMGYGLATWKFALSSVHNDCNCALNSVKEMLSIYKSIGFKPKWTVTRVDIECN